MKIETTFVSNMQCGLKADKIQRLTALIRNQNTDTVAKPQLALLAEWEE